MYRMLNLDRAKSRFIDALAVWIACFAVESAFAQGPKGATPATVVVGKVVEREEAAGQTFVGTLEPRRRSVVGSAVDGRVEEYPINDGQWVKKGDVVAELLKEAIKIEVRNAEAELAFRQAELDEYENGALVEDKLQAEAKLASAEAQLKYARARHDRTAALFQRGAGVGITQEDMDLAYSNLTAAEQNQIAAKAALKLLEDWPRPEKIAQATAHRDAQQEMVNQLKDRLAKFTIRAPFDGYVVTKHTEVGAWINRGDHIVDVIEIDPIEAALSVPESSIASLQEALAQAEVEGVDLEAVVKVDALGDLPFAGRVERIVPQADVRSRTFPVKVLVKNPVQGKSHKLKAGMICHVSLAIGRRQKVTLVPKDAVVLGGQTPRVMVVDTSVQPPVGRPVPVEIVASFGTDFQVAGGLKAGMTIVLRGNERLLPGQPLNIVNQQK